MTTQITLVRHGQTDWNACGKIQGSSNIPLNDIGIQQARDKACFFKNESFDLAYTSPLDRAKETLDILLTENKFSIPIFEDARFKERSFGIYEGQEVHVIQKDRKDNALSNSYEQNEKLEKRILDGLYDLVKNHTRKNILVTAHSHVLKGALVGLFPEKFSYKDFLDNLGVCTLEYNSHSKQWNILYNEVGAE